MNEQHEHWIDNIESKLKVKMNPIFDRMINEIDFLPPPPDPLRPSPSIEQLKADYRSELEQTTFSREEYRRVLRGRDLIVAGLDGTPHPDQCRSELTAAFEKLAAMEDEAEELVSETIDRIEQAGAEPELDEESLDQFWEEFKSLREELGISEQTYEELYGIGIKHYQDRDIEAAVSIFRFLTILDVACYEAWLTYGLCQKELGELDEALNSFLTAISTDGREPTAYLQLAHTFYLKGDESAATSIVELGNANLKEMDVAPDVFQEWQCLSNDLAKTFS